MRACAGRSIVIAGGTIGTRPLQPVMGRGSGAVRIAERPMRDKIETDPMTNRKLSLDEIGHGFALMRGGKSTRAVIAY